MPDDYHGLPTPRTTLRAGYVRVLVWCKSCLHRADADLPALVASGRGDVPLGGAALVLCELRQPSHRFFWTGLSTARCTGASNLVADAASPPQRLCCSGYVSGASVNIAGACLSRISSTTLAWRSSTVTATTLSPGVML